MVQTLWIALFGSLGVLSRYFLDLQISRFLPAQCGLFPVGTVLINTLGSMLAGALYIYGVEKGELPPSLTLGLIVGFCGGFTTFSAYALQSVLLMEKAQYGLVLGYLFLSLFLGLLGVMLVFWLLR